MTTNIKNTIVSALEEKGISIAGQYETYVDLAVSALEEREYGVRDNIVNAATSGYGVGEREVNSILTNAGMAERPAPEPEPETEAVTESGDDSDGSLDAVLKAVNAIGDRLDKLEGVARSRGLL